MRKDFNKVLTERPRVGHKDKHKNVRRAYNFFDYDDDDAPVGGVEGMKKPYNERKTPSDLWGAIKRLMASNVGRPWNDVFSELNRDLHESDDMRAHFLAHVRIEVDEKVCIADNGRLYRPGGRRNWQLGSDFSWDNTFPGEVPGCFKRFYVDPRDGILYKTPDAPSGWVNPRYRTREPSNPEYGWLMDDGVTIKYFDGVWYEVSVTWRRESFFRSKFVGREPNGDVIYKKVLEYQDVPVFNKRQLNTKELRTYGVINAS